MNKFPKNFYENPYKAELIISLEILKKNYKLMISIFLI